MSKPREFKITDKEMLAMEKLFAAELPPNNSLPGQVRHKRIAQSLVKKGLAHPCYAVLQDKFGSLTVTGYQLTMKGHMAYCEWAAEQCKDEFDDEDEVKK